MPLRRADIFRLLPLATLLALGACAAPTTLGPKANQAEIAAEEAHQAESYKQAKLQGFVRGTTSGKPVAPRLKAVAERIAPVAVALCGDLHYADPSECAYPINLTSKKDEEDSALNAYADGEQVYITRAMVQFASQDEDLAFVLAHEFAHNIMYHTDSMTKNVLVGALLGAAVDAAAAYNGVNTGGNMTSYGASGGRLAYSPAFEHEADYIGLYLLARAGYDYHTAPDFWRRMSHENPDAIYTSTTHPSNAERFVVMRKTIEEIDRKVALTQPLIPEFKQGRQ